MSNLNLGYLQSYSVDGQLNFWGRGHGVISCSSDNQIALVHKKGVSIYECRQTPGIQKRPPKATVFASQINGPGRQHIPDTGSVVAENVMCGFNKQNIFELQRDPILRPHGYDYAVFINYFIKAQWSTVPFYRGQNTESRCILGVLTCCNQLLIYGKRDRRLSSKDTWTEPWELLIDLAPLYNSMLLEQWETEKEIVKKEDAFESYKSRLYELSIVDFIWIPDWRLDPNYKNTDETKGVFKSYFMTFHANGDAIIWKIMASKTVSSTFSAVLLCKSKITDDDDFISCASYSLISSNSGLLVVGTNKGKMSAHVVEKQKQIKNEKKKQSNQPFQKYKIKDGVELWDEDMLRIESILLKPESSGRTKTSILAVKHPNIILASSLSVSMMKVTHKEFSILKVPNGPIAGLSKNDELFIVLHESGVLSQISYANGKLEYLIESSVSIFDPYKSGKKKKNLLGGVVQKIEKVKKKSKELKYKRLLFHGLGTSPNNSLLFIGRTIGMYYDHLKIRRPSQIVFYSLLPYENVWSYVRNLYAENQFSMRAISDVLVPYRCILRGIYSEYNYKELLDWAVNLDEKSTEDLRLLYWCLKLRRGSDASEWEVANAEKMFNPQAMRKLVAVDALHKYRLDLIADKIIQRRCISLIRAVLGNPKIPSFNLQVNINKQCLKTMFEYLSSKENITDLPKMPDFDPLPTLPICYWCKGPLEFPLEPIDYQILFEDAPEELKTELDKEVLSGFKWNLRRHPVKEYGIHKPELCVISLLPLKFPYRFCSNCFVTCLMDLPFDQSPFCPLCNSFMYPAQPTLNVEDAEEEMEITLDTKAKNSRKLTEKGGDGVLIKQEPVEFLQETAEPMQVDSQSHTGLSLLGERLDFEVQSWPQFDIENWADQNCSSSESDGYDEEEEENGVVSTSDDE